MKLSGESAPGVTSTCSQERAVPISSGISHTYKHIHTFVHSLIMVMDSTRQSSDEDAGAREMNHFAQVVFHTERNQTSEASWKAARQTCNILQPTQHNSGLKFSWYSGAQRDVLSSSTRYSSSAKIHHTLGTTQLGKTAFSLVGVFHPNTTSCPTMPPLSISW